MRTLLAFLRSWGPVGDKRNNVAAQLRAVLGRSGLDADVVRRLLRSAGFSRSVSDLVGEVLARYGDSSVEVAGLQVRDLAEVLGGLAPEGVTRLLRSSGYPGEVSALVGALLDRYGDPEAAEAAGPQVRVVAGLVEFADEDLLAFLRSWGPVGDERNNVAAQLRAVLGRSGLDADVVRRLVRSAGFSKAGSDLVGEVLRRDGDAGADASGVGAGDLARLVSIADEDLVGLVRAWGPVGDKRNNVAAQLRAVLGRSGLDADVVRRLLRSAGFSRSVSDLVGEVLARYGDSSVEVAGLQVRDLAEVLGGLAPEGVTRLLRSSGYPGEVSALVGALLDRYGDPEAAEAAGPQVRVVAGLVEFADEDLLAFLRSWGPVGDERNNVAAQLRAVLGRSGLDADVVRRLVRSAGFSRSVSDLVGEVLRRDGDAGAEASGVGAGDLARLVSIADEDLVGLVRAWGPVGDKRNNVAAQLRAVLGRSGLDADVVRRLVRSAGFSRSVSDLVGEVLRRDGDAGAEASGVGAGDLARLVSIADEDLVGLVRAWGPVGDKRNNVAAQLRAVLGRSGLDADVVRRLLRSAGFSRSVSDLVGEVLARYGDSSVEVAGLQVRDLAEVLGGLAPEGVTRLLRSSGYPGEVSALVGALLDRYGDPEAAEAAGPQVRVVAGLVEFADEDLLAFLRSWGPVGDERNNVAAQLRAVLGRSGLDADVVRRLVRSAGFSRSVSDLVGEVLRRDGDAGAEASGVGAGDLARLVSIADEDLVGLVRAWGPVGDKRNNVAAQLRAVLGRSGLDADVVRRLVRSAGFSRSVSDLVGEVLRRDGDAGAEASGVGAGDLARLVSIADEDLVGLVRAWGPVGDKRNNVAAQLRAVLGRSGLDADVVRRLLRSAGFSRSVSDLVGEVLARYGDSSVEVAGLQVRDLAEVLGGLAPEGVTRLLRSSGYPGEVSALVGALLDRYGDPEAAEAAGPQVRVVAGLVEFADEDLLAFLRSWGPVGDKRNNVAAQLRAVLGRSGLDADVVRRLVRSAGFSRSVSDLVVEVLRRDGDAGADAPGVGAGDLARLVSIADAGLGRVGAGLGAGGGQAQQCGCPVAGGVGSFGFGCRCGAASVAVRGVLEVGLGPGG